MLIVEIITNDLKEAEEVIGEGLLIAIFLKGLPPNFKAFTTVITQKKKALHFFLNLSGSVVQGS